MKTQPEYTYATHLSEEVDSLLDELKTAREHAQGLRAERNTMIEEVQATPAFKALSEAGTEADETTAQIEADIRAMTLELYGADAALPERVSVKMFPVVSIPNELAAKTWAISNFTPALKLDTKVFEDAAKKGNIPAEIATVTKEPRAQIATKL